MSAIEEPKKSLTSFFIYLKENRPTFVKELGEKASGKGVVSKYGSEKWNSLSAEEKKPYDQKAAEGKAAYAKAMVDFKAQGGEAGKRRAEKRERKTGKKSKRFRSEDMPKKPAGGAYGSYMAENRALIQKSLPAGSKCTEVSKIGGERWKKISPEDKEKFEKLYLEKKAKYEEAMKEWKDKQAAEGDENDEEDGEEDDEEQDAKDDEVLAVPSPTKRPRLSSSPGKAKKAGGEEVLAEAKKEGLAIKLKAMMENPKISAKGDAQTLLDALRKAGGKVAEAKRVLLGK